MFTIVTLKGTPCFDGKKFKSREGAWDFIFAATNPDANLDKYYIIEI